jgi:hypothetical protein
MDPRPALSGGRLCSTSGSAGAALAVLFRSGQADPVQRLAAEGDLVAREGLELDREEAAALTRVVREFTPALAAVGRMRKRGEIAFRSLSLGSPKARPEGSQ